MEATVRKNFVFDRTIAEHLKELADNDKQSMTAFVQELIEERHKEYKYKRRIQALNNILGSANGLLTDFSIQSVKAQMDV